MSSVEVLDIPDKSEIDKKSYRVIRLANGIKALLISAPNHKKVDNVIQSDEESDTDNRPAACSVCVDVGSFSNPPDVQGLAHFLGELISN